LVLLTMHAAGDQDSATMASALADPNAQVRRLAVMHSGTWVRDSSTMMQYEALRAFPHQESMPQNSPNGDPSCASLRTPHRRPWAFHSCPSPTTVPCLSPSNPSPIICTSSIGKLASEVDVLCVILRKRRCARGSALICRGGRSSEPLGV
jgi:hypothetical protein